MVKEIHDNIPLTKGHLKEFKSLIKSKEYFMLSELIDNSLSSYIRHTNDFKNERVEYDEKGFIKKIDDFIIEINYKKGLESRDNTITIIDNAYGILPENIKEVLTPGGGDQNSKDSKLNVYGMGLKQAAWWSGEKLKILTKREELDFRYFTEIDLDDGASSEEVAFDAVPNGERINFIYDKDEFYLHGTRIEISKLNANKYQKLAEQIIFLSKDQNNINMYHTANEMVIPAISLKYKKWIEKGMKIIFSYTDDNDEKNNDWLIFDKNSFNIPIEEPIKTLKSHVAEIYRENNDYRNKYESEIHFFAVASQEILDDIKNDYGINSAYELAEDILLNCDKNENFQMKEKIPLDIPGLEKPVFVEFKYISSLQKKDRFFSRYRGLYIYDFDRAIHTGPNEKNVRNEQGFGTYDIYSEPDVTRDTELNLRSLFGEMDIDYLIAEEIVRLDSNKRGIITNEGATKDFSAAVLESAKKFTGKYGPLITKINKWFKQTKEENQKPSDSAESGAITNIATSQTNIAKNYVGDSVEKNIIETKTLEEVEEIIKKDSTKQQLSVITLKLNSKSEKIFFSITEEEGEKYSYPYRYELDYDQEEQREVYNIKLNVRSILFIPSLNGIDSDNRKKAQKSIKATFYKMSWIDILSDIVVNKHLKHKDNVDKFSFVNNDDFFLLIYEEFGGNLISIKEFLVRQVFG